MEITDVKIRRIVLEGRLRAIVSVTLSGCIAIHDIKVVQGEERLFVAMPSRKDENGVFRDIIHPITSDMRQRMEVEIIDAYQRQLAMLEAEEAEAEAAMAAEDASDEIESDLFN